MPTDEAPAPLIALDSLITFDDSVVMVGLPRVKRYNRFVALAVDAMIGQDNPSATRMEKAKVWAMLAQAEAQILQMK